jgi:aminopeptidase N
VPTFRDGTDGLGDRYYPEAGGSGYDAKSYAIDVAWDGAKGTMAGTTTMTAVATADLRTLHVDLALAVSGAQVDGATATVAAGQGTDRIVTLPSPVRSGQTFSLKLTYAGHPADYAGPDGASPVETNGAETLIAAEPGSAPAWFPSNDHPSDPATYDIRVRVLANQAALSVGRLVSRDEDSDPATATWHWTLDRPAATYLTFLALGDFVIEETTDAGRPAVFAVSASLPAALRTGSFATLKKTGAAVTAFEKRFGTYPWGEVGGVVTNTKGKWAALECATRPVYHLAGAPLPESTLVHEVAHQWFGNNVALKSWPDIVNNEGWATYAELTFSADGFPAPPDLQQRLKETWATAPDAKAGGPLADPGRDAMFSKRSYVGGAAALAALRNVIGADSFATIERSWAQTQGPRSVRDFQVFVEAQSGRDLTAFWAAWYTTTTPPPQTSAFGYPG